MGINNIIALLSGVALFLFGMSLMGDGLKKVAGNRLEVVLYKLTNTPLKGFLLGTGVTAVIQSSSATSVMVVGFVNSGMMTVRQSISIVMGAIVGTSITGWVICLSTLSGNGWLELFSTATLTGVIAVVGICLRNFSKDKTRNHVGDILMGFAVLMFGIAAMSDSVSPLRSSPFFLGLMVKLSQPVLGILFGVAFTAILQSASAAVGILQALASTGVISFAVALPVIMGVAIGAAVPVLLSSVGANTDGKRAAMVYLVVEAAGVVVCAVLFYVANALFQFDFLSATMTSVSIALLNTVFRLVKVLIFMPFIDGVEKVVDFLVKDKPTGAQAIAAQRLEERFIQHPALAIEQSRITINAMAEDSRRNLMDAIRLLHEYSEDGFEEIENLEGEIDQYEDMLGSYLVKLTGRDMTARQSDEVSKFLHTISDFERISDHALNIGEAAQEMHSKQIGFSAAAAQELQVLEDAITEIVRVCIDAFVSGDLEMAARVEPLEEVIDTLCDELKLHHVDRLQKGLCTIKLGFVFNDLLTNYERVADHCSNIAVAMIELESNSFDTHEYLKSLRAMRTEAFARHLEEYSKKYSL